MDLITIRSDGLLFLLALTSALGTWAIYSPPRFNSVNKAFGQFAFALITAEMAPFWLLLQAFVALALVGLSALSSTLGVVSLVVLLLSWAGLLWSIRMSLATKAIVETELKAQLGENYLDVIPESQRRKLEYGLRLRDWFNPLGFGKPDIEVIRDINYQPGGIRNQLDIYRPKVIPPEGCPVLLQIHGGAWMVGKKGSQGMALMKLLASSGWICVDANYRLSPNVGMPVHIQDCKAALCWIRKNGADYGMDTSFVAVTGGSAGGHLSSLLGVTANLPALQPGMEDIDTSVQASVPFYGPHDITYRFKQNHNSEEAQEWLTGVVMHESPAQNAMLWELVSPLSHIREDAPPYMLLHGHPDSVVPVKDSQVFSRELRKTSSKPVVYAELPGAAHGFDYLNSIRSRHAVTGVHRFLEWARYSHTGK